MIPPRAPRVPRLKRAPGAQRRGPVPRPPQGNNKSRHYYPYPGCYPFYWDWPGYWYDYDYDYGYDYDWDWDYMSSPNKPTPRKSSKPKQQMYHYDCEWDIQIAYQMGFSDGYAAAEAKTNEVEPAPTMVDTEVAPVTPAPMTEVPSGTI